MHSTLRLSDDAGFSLAYEVNGESFDFFSPMMPQSGVSKIVLCQQPRRFDADLRYECRW